jgi:hypothetical protein
MRGLLRQTICVTIYLRFPPVKRLLFACLLLPLSLIAQTAIPAGTILPLRLSSSLSSRKSKAGQPISARLMQDVPLPSGGKIHAGSKAIGRILDVVHATDGSVQLSFIFDTLAVSHQKIPMTTNLRALASLTEVQDAQTPKTGPDRGTPQNAWTTVQIGGDVVYRGGGPVARGLQVVGTPTADGVLVQVASKSSEPCRADVNGNDHPQAFWVFSADACGTYGFDGLRIVHAGRTAPIGQITLASAGRSLHIHGGSGLLLRVQ